MKPRKSFGTEGAERFHMRAGAAGERASGRDDRRTRDRDEREPGERRSRNLDFFNLKDKDGEELEEPRRNGPTRGKSDSWFRGGDTTADTGNGEGAPVSQRERIDKAKSWRDRDPNANANDRRGERTNERNQERRWEREREQRNERDPEWLDEPAGETPQGRTQEDFERFMETMKGKKEGAAAKAEQKAPEPIEPRAELEQKPAFSAPAHDPPAEDKFFSMFGGQTQFTTLGGAAEAKEAARPKPVKATSRFMNFLPNQDRARTEPPTPAAPINASNLIPEPPSNNNERQAFAALISKLQGSRIGASPEAAGQASQSLAKLFERPPAQQEPAPSKSAMAPQESFQHYGGAELREDPRLRGPMQHQSHQMISPRQMMPPSQPPPVSHPEQALHELLAQRHNLPNLQNQGNNRAPPNNPPMNSNTEFLMRLMQSQRDVPEPPTNRPEMLSRMSQPNMSQPNKQVSLSGMPDRDQDYQRDPGQSQRQQYHQQILQQQQAQAQQRQHARGPPGPPGYMEEQFHSPEMDSRPQPTQILQRPPPPGMDHHGMHPFQMGPGGPTGAGGPMPPPPQQQQQQQQRSMIPPPGLVNQRNVNPPQSLSGMYPNYPPPGPGYGAPPLPPPEALGNGGLGGGPRGMVPPPGFFGVGLPPPGFMPPPGMSPGGFQGGPDGFPVGPPGPFDRRAMAPPGYRGP